MARELGGDVWIGFHDKHNEGAMNFKWEDKSTVSKIFFLFFFFIFFRFHLDIPI